MKNILTISILAVILVLGILFIIPKSNISSNIGADDISDRFKWLKARLQDPATGEIPRFARSRELAYAHTLPGSIGNIKTKYDRMLSNRWDTRGPINVGGRTRALALDVTNENIILAGGVSGGIWRSTDAGISWNRSTGLDQIGSVSCVVQDKRKGKEKTWYNAFELLT